MQWKRVISLIKGHMSKMCRKRLDCKTCHKRHPTILHVESMPSKEQHTSQTYKGGSNFITVAMVSAAQKEVGSLDYKLAILPAKIKACNGNDIIQTFLDPGSSATFLTFTQENGRRQ